MRELSASFARRPVRSAPHSPVWQRHSAGLVMAGARLLGTAQQFLVQLLLAHLGGPAAVGVMQTFQSWVSVGGELTAQGTPSRAMRDIALRWDDQDRRGITQQLRNSIGQILLGTFVVGAVVIAIALPARLGGQPEQSNSLFYIWTALAAAMVMALLRLHAESAKAMDSATSAVLIETLVPSGSAIIALSTCWALGIDLDQPAIIATTATALLLTMGGLIRLTKQQVVSLPNDQAVLASSAPERPARWDQQTVSLWLVGLLGVIALQLPFLTMTMFGAAEDIGVYAIAFKLLALATTILMMLSAMFGPKFARAAKASCTTEARQLLWRSQWASAVIFVPIALAILATSHWLAMAFNVPGQQLTQFLLIIGIGQIFNAATGLPGLLLNMSGEAHTEMKISSACLLLSLLALYPIGSQYGVLGLAWLFTAMTAAKNLTSFLFAHKTIGGWRP